MKKMSLFFVFVLFLEGVFSESVPVSVTEGDPVPLNTGLTEIQRDEVLEWRFGAKRLRIAIINKAAGTITYEDVPGGNFKDRLKLNDQTGSLTVMDSRISDSGEYEVSTFTATLKTFSVTVKVKAAPDSGLSPGGIAGIVIAVLGVISAAIGGFYYSQRKKRQEI